MNVRLLTTLLLGAIPALSLGQTDSDGSLPLFASQETLAIEIEGPLRTLLAERSDSEYYVGMLRYAEKDGTERELDLQFRARGNFRRRKTTCRFPPVRLNFKKNQVEGTEFDGQNILKLVTHCRPRSDNYEQYAIKEYLAYKIYELHSPYHFRTRLVRINWIDNERDGRAEERYGFLIEHKNEIGARLQLDEVEFERVTYEPIHKRYGSIVAMFQYLIGNTDFSMIAGPAGDSCCHNAILMTADGETYIPIPYDFDFSGLVNAPYAGPNPRFKIKSVTTRLYRGNCALNEEVQNTVALFLEKQGAVMELIDNQEGLSRSARNRARTFIKKFYADLSNPRRVETKFIKGCA